MSRALSLAKEGVGDVWPNPSVGCLIVLNDCVVSEGHTAKGGRPHAETIALKIAGKKAKGAVAYVTLEPCAHKGETEPCVKALVQAGIKKIIYSVKDPDPRVSGNGEIFLKSNGIEVIHGLMEKEALDINEGFFKKIKTGLPFVTLKFGTSEDGKIATKGGISKWITSKKSRVYGHEMRSEHDAILIGLGTVLNDNPSLTCRIKGKEGKSPVRIILDTNLRIPKDCHLINTACEVPTWVITENKMIDCLEDFGVKIINVKNIKNIHSVLKVLANAGLTKILVEGGSKVLGSFFHQGFGDKIAWFKAPVTIGPEGIPAIEGFELKDIYNSQIYKSNFKKNIDKDVLEIFLTKG